MRRSDHSKLNDGAMPRSILPWRLKLVIKTSQFYQILSLPQYGAYTSIQVRINHRACNALIYCTITLSALHCLSYSFVSLSLRSRHRSRKVLFSSEEVHSWGRTSEQQQHRRRTTGLPLRSVPRTPLVLLKKLSMARSANLESPADLEKRSPIVAAFPRLPLQLSSDSELTRHVEKRPALPGRSSASCCK